MSAELLESLPLTQRLALSYAPRAARTGTLALLALDQRLANILRAGGEPIITQMKLAWWRDRLGEAPAAWPEGEPLLANLRQWPGDVGGLIALVDGWETLLTEDLATPAILEFADGRAQSWKALASGLGAASPDAALAAGRHWALVDLALNLGTATEREAVLQEVAADGPAQPRLDRVLRPLAVLHALARRAVKRGTGHLLPGPSAGLLALRVGITGR